MGFGGQIRLGWCCSVSLSVRGIVEFGARRGLRWRVWGSEYKWLFFPLMWAAFSASSRPESALCLLAGRNRVSGGIWGIRL